MSINRVCISGNLTRDPELRHTASGMAVLTVGVAVNDRRRNQQTGQWEDCPNFVDCTMFGNRAESVSGFLSKGTKVFIEGKLRWSQCERDGQKRSKLEVVVDEIEFGARQAPPQHQAQRQAPQPYQAAPQPYQAQPIPAQQPVQEQPAPAYYDEDIPF